MSARPSELVNWDINNVNSTRPDDSIKDNGYTNDAVPDAGDINWILQFLSAWVAYHEALTQPFEIPACDFQKFAGAPTLGTEGNEWTVPASCKLVAGLRVPVGTILSSILFSIKPGLVITDTGVITLNLNSRAAGGAVTTLRTINIAYPPGGTVYANYELMTTAYTTIAGDRLSLELITNGGVFDTNPLFDGVKVTRG